MSVTPTPQPAPIVVPAPSLTPEYVIAAITMLVGLFATQGLISNNVEKIITGVAVVVVPLIVVAVQAFVKSQAHKAKVAALAANPSLRLG